MASQIQKDDVFKFVAVRPPQKPTNDKLTIQFIRYAENEESSFHKVVANMSGEIDGRNKAIQLAKDFITSGEYVANHGSPQYQAFRKFADIANSVAPELQKTDAQQATDEVVAHLESLMESSVSDFIETDKFKSFKEQLWNSLYANSLVPRERPRDRENILKSIRLVHFLERVSQGNRESEQLGLLKELFAATPLLPKDLFPKPTEAVKKDTIQREDSSTGRKTAEALIKKEMVHLEEAVNDVRRSHQRGLIELAIRDKKAQGPLSPSLSLFQRIASLFGLSSGKARNPSPAKSVTDSQNEPQSGVTVGMQYLSDSTMALMREHKIPFESLSVPEVVASLEQELGDQASLLFSQPASSKIMQLGGVLVEPGSILEGLERAPRVVAPFPEVPGVRVLGVGDLMVVEQTLLKYEEGELAHIENVMKSEENERRHRRLNRTEQSLFTATDETTESEKDLQSTERFELQRESAKTIQSDSKLNAGVTVTASWGPVSTTAHAEFATSTSTNESNRTATNYAKDITQRSASRVREQVREERTRKTVEEIVERNKHGFDNKGGPDHIRGVYRWVDKIYLAQVVNYGRRLMIEFIVPEPAAFYIQAESQRSIEGVTLAKPVEPKIMGSIVGTVSGGFSPTDLHPWDYTLWVHLYEVQGAEPPPPETLTIATAFNQTYTPGNALFTAHNKELTVPAGYIAGIGIATILARGYMYLSVGGNLQYIYYNGIVAFTLNSESSVVPVSLLADADAYAANIEITCHRLPSTFEKWQLNTYNAIITSYQKMKAAYDEQLAASQIRQGVQITGRNPGRNREIESEELKKGCLTFLLRPTPPNTAFDQFDAIEPQPPFGYPEIDIDKSVSDGRTIQFMEQAFEWNQLTYLFYPYFWGDKSNWVNIHQLEDADPLFTKFLQAGAARVLVPVHPNFEQAVLHYLGTLEQSGTGELWNGGEVPTLDDDLFISVAEEIKAQTGGDASGIKVGAPWEVKIPTSLVILQDIAADPVLPDWSAQLGR